MKSVTLETVIDLKKWYFFAWDYKKKMLYIKFFFQNCKKEIQCLTVHGIVQNNLQKFSQTFRENKSCLFMKVNVHELSK